MPTAKNGDTVHVHYTGRLEDGTVFDTSEGRKPLEFTLGRGQVIAGFERAVVGLSEGETAATHVSPDEAFGHRSEDLVLKVQRDTLPADVRPEPGQRFEMTTGDGYKIPVRVTETHDDAIVVDANHPLAGRELDFDVQLVKIV